MDDDKQKQVAARLGCTLSNLAGLHVVSSTQAKTNPTDQQTPTHPPTNQPPNRVCRAVSAQGTMPIRPEGVAPSGMALSATTSTFGIGDLRRSQKSVTNRNKVYIDR